MVWNSAPGVSAGAMVSMSPSLTKTDLPSGVLPVTTRLTFIVCSCGEVPELYAVWRRPTYLLANKPGESSHRAGRVDTRIMHARLPHFLARPRRREHHVAA